jgi:hypothetical protein
MTTTKRMLVIAPLLAVLGLWAGIAEAKCPAGLQRRAPHEVVADLWAALAASDWEAVACNYGRKAFVIDDQGVLVGSEEIVNAYMSLYSFAAGAVPVATETNIFRDVVRVLYRLDAGWWEIEDGVDTYWIKRGRIERQTRHGLITFTGPPPDVD